MYLLEDQSRLLLQHQAVGRWLILYIVLYPRFSKTNQKVTSEVDVE
jgi:hypothetical protein